MIHLNIRFILLYSFLLSFLFPLLILSFSQRKYQNILRKNITFYINLYYEEGYRKDAEMNQISLSSKNY